MKKNNSGIYRLLLFVSGSLFLGLACNFLVDYNVPDRPLDLTATSDPTKGLVCASYFQKWQSSDYIQGPWTNDREVTGSAKACHDWVENSVLNQADCAQYANTKSIIMVLIDQSRHSYFLPADLNHETEFVFEIDCYK